MKRNGLYSSCMLSVDQDKASRSVCRKLKKGDRIVFERSLGKMLMSVYAQKVQMAVQHFTPGKTKSALVGMKIEVLPDVETVMSLISLCSGFRYRICDKQEVNNKEFEADEVIVVELL